MIDLILSIIIIFLLILLIFNCSHRENYSVSSTNTVLPLLVGSIQSNGTYSSVSFLGSNNSLYRFTASPANSNYDFIININNLTGLKYKANTPDTTKIILSEYTNPYNTVDANIKPIQVNFNNGIPLCSSKQPTSTTVSQSCGLGTFDLIAGTYNATNPVASVTSNIALNGRPGVATLKINSTNNRWLDITGPDLPGTVILRPI